MRLLIGDARWIGVRNRSAQVDDGAVIRYSLVVLQRWRGVPLLVRRPLTMVQCSAARSLVFDDGAVIRCSLVGFEWCALDGQESGVVPFGVKIVG